MEHGGKKRSIDYYLLVSLDGLKGDYIDRYMTPEAKETGEQRAETTKVYFHSGKIHFNIIFEELGYVKYNFSILGIINFY